MQSHISRQQRIPGGTAGIWRIPILRQNLPAGWAVGNDPTVKGTDEAPTSR
jgi:hypothetical protein